MKVLVLNCGSSSLKFALIQAGPPEFRPLARGQVEPIGAAESRISCQILAGQRLTFSASVPDHNRAAELALQALAEDPGGLIRAWDEIQAVGHRIVHGGDRFHQPVVIDQAVLQAIRECVPLAPLHNPHNLSGYFASRRVLPRALHVAVFDTAFHQTLPPKAYTYALPHELCSRYRVRRYGFHGTSHRWMAERFAQLRGAPPEALRLITCHLGNGCSICAIAGGRSLDTSTGMTPLEGLVMGTRSGDLDTGAVLRLMHWEQLDIERMEALLYKSSGLDGISGLSHDMRVLLEEAARGNQRAALAIEVFCYRIRKYIGAYYAVLNGADALIFTGGIGENAPPIRAAVCDSLDALGIRLDPALNQAALGREMDISAAGAATRVWVIPTNEELLIARETVRAIIGPQGEAGLS